LAKAEARVAELSASVKNAEALLQDLQQEKQRLQHQRTTLKDLEGRLAQSERELREIEVQIGDRRQRLKAYETALAERQQVEEGYVTLGVARKAEAAWNERLSRVVRFQEQQRELERAVDAARRELDLARERLSARLGDLKRLAAELPAQERELTAVRARVADLVQRHAERDAAQTELQALAEDAAGLKVRNEQLKTEMDALKEKRDLLAREAGEAQCPLCGQALTEQHRAELLDGVHTEGTALADTYRANTARRTEIQAESKRLKAEIQRLDRELARQPTQQRQEAQLEQALAQAQGATAELESVRADADALEKRLQDGEYAPVHQAELARLLGDLDALGYDPDAHEKARTEVAALTKYEALHQRLQTALERIDEERSFLEELQGRQARWQESVADDQAERALLVSEVGRLTEVSKRVEAKAQ
jgi:exonuclease SbcC